MIKATSRRLVYVVSCGVLLVALVALCFLLLRKDRNHISQDDPSYSVCFNDDIGTKIKTNYRTFGYEQTAEISALVEKIKNHDEAYSSINCVVFLAKYYGHVADYAALLEVYDSVRDIYERTGKWADESVTAETPETMAALAENAKKQLESIRARSQMNKPIHELIPEEE